jgi:TolA-binding protein
MSLDIYQQYEKILRYLAMISRATLATLSIYINVGILEAATESKALIPIELLDNDSRFDRINKAEELYSATLYEAASEEYRAVLDSNINGDKHHRTLAICRLGQIYHYLGDYQRALDYFSEERTGIEDIPPSLQLLEMQAAYVTALCNRQLGQNRSALENLERHVIISRILGKPPLQEAIYERALNQFLLGDLAKAKEQFASISSSDKASLTAKLARLYLGRIAIVSEEYAAADNILKEISKELSQGDSLQFEIAYLLGENAFKKGDYHYAIEQFKKSIPNRNQKNSAWYSEALYQLGWSYLKIANKSNDREGRKGFSTAEEYFQAALTSSPSERFLLALAECYIMKGELLGDREALIAADKLLTDPKQLKSEKGKACALLLRAQTINDLQLKNDLYLELTSDLYKETPIYTRGWYCRGLHEYIYGLELKKISEEKSKQLFGQAADSLQNAYRLLRENSPFAGALAMRWRIQALIESDLPTAISAAEKFAEDEIILYSSLDKPEEIFYFCGQEACRIAESKNDINAAEIAERALWRVVTDAPNGDLADASLYLLGVSYLRQGQSAKAEETFLHLIARYPHSSYAAEALFRCAENAEKNGRDPEIIKSYRQQLYTSYPASSFAPSAFFNYYSYRDYLQGDKDALRHLKEFMEQYPDSPLQVTASYLTGLDYKRDRKTSEGRSLRKRNLQKAIEAFSDVEKQFDLQRNKIEEWELPYYITLRYRALLEKAWANNAISEESQGAKRQIYWQYADSIYKQILEELSDSTNPLGRYLLKSEPFPQVHEESLYRLAKLYLNAGNNTIAEAQLNEILEKYREQGIQKSYYLSCVYYERGMLEMNRDRHEQAWQEFMHAEESSAAGKLLSSEEKLNLWIQQSLCYKSLGQIDKAMLMLSKVINDDAISGLRVKAMLLRADLYALQGRHELARKQLEATARKGGEWAHQAKKKLDSDYGFQ